MDIDGHGLRETLFFQLFSYLQVYETKSHMKNALKYIKTAAVSLDGGMIIFDKDMRDVEFGCRYWIFSFECRCLSLNFIFFGSKSMCWNLTVSFGIAEKNQWSALQWTITFRWHYSKTPPNCGPYIKVKLCVI